MADPDGSPPTPPGRIKCFTFLIQGSRLIRVVCRFRVHCFRAFGFSVLVVWVGLGWGLGLVPIQHIGGKVFKLDGLWAYI